MPTVYGQLSRQGKTQFRFVLNRWLFSEKKYKGAVNASGIRDFREATVGRADRGLFITTSNFTKFAIKEANRDGASALDLVDGDQLISKLKELSLGVKTEMIEEVTVDSEWFISL